MKFLTTVVLAVTCVAAISGRTDAKMAQFTSLGRPGHIKCYSGAQAIYEGDSTGKISTEQGSDGWFFQEKGTNDLIRVSGACVIRN